LKLNVEQSTYLARLEHCAFEMFYELIIIQFESNDT